MRRQRVDVAPTNARRVGARNGYSGWRGELQKKRWTSFRSRLLAADNARRYQVPDHSDVDARLQLWPLNKRSHRQPD
jgi:hypothetical protein